MIKHVFAVLVILSKLMWNNALENDQHWTGDKLCFVIVHYFPVTEEVFYSLHKTHQNIATFLMSYFHNADQQILIVLLIPNLK